MNVITVLLIFEWVFIGLEAIALKDGDNNSALACFIIVNVFFTGVMVCLHINEKLKKL